MKGSSVIISVIALIAVAVLYVLYFTDNAGKVAENEPAAQRLSETGGEVRIAYVKADSILLNYSLAQNLHDEFTKKQEAYNTEYSDKRQTFEKEAAAFQEKLQRGGFLTEQRAVQERDRLVSKEQEIMQLDQDLSSRLAEMQTANNRQILDSLMNYLKDYNRNNKYDYILNGSSVLMGKDAHNLTGEVLDALNERYLGEGE